MVEVKNVEHALSVYNERYKGKLWCFASVADHTPGLFTLGIVVDGEDGYYTIPIQLAAGTEREMSDYAGKLNSVDLKIPQMTALQLITQSMRSSRRRRSAI